MKSIKFLAGIFPLLLLNLYSCSEKSSCENTMCLNGGICLDGTCDCPKGFEGTHCQERAKPDYMRITSLTLTRFPNSNENEAKPWDASDGPDIFFRLFDGPLVIAQPDKLIENANMLRPTQFDFHFIELNKPEAVYHLDLFDYDGIDIPDEFMGSISFVPFDRSKGFPQNIILDDGGTIAFTMTVDYYYNNY